MVDMVRTIYEHRPLTAELIVALTPDVRLEDDDNSQVMLEDLEEDIAEIGYPDSSSRS